MQQLSLAAEIAGKNKKAKSTVDPLFFSEIQYEEVKEINYLTDLQQKKKQNIDFPILEFEEEFKDGPQVNEYDLLADRLYKKIMQTGNINERKAAPSKKKKKKTKNPFEYDYEDQFIDDEQVFAPRKNVELKFENFSLAHSGVEQFYSSEFYKKSMNQIQEQSKKRPNDIDLGPEQLELIKKKIKEDIASRINTESKLSPENDKKYDRQTEVQVSQLQDQPHEKHEAITSKSEEIGNADAPSANQNGKASNPNVSPEIIS